jgi:hypothetical protein
MSSTTTPNVHTGRSGCSRPIQPSDKPYTGEDQPDRIYRRDLIGGLVHEYRQAA